MPFSSNHKTINIVKGSSGFSYKSIYESMEELFKDYIHDDQKFEPMEIESDASLIDAAEKLIAEPSKEKVKN